MAVLGFDQGPRKRSIAAESSGQNRSTSASVAIEPTRPFDQNTRRSPPIRSSTGGRNPRAFPRTSARVNGASGMAISEHVATRRDEHSQTSNMAFWMA